MEAELRQKDLTGAVFRPGFYGDRFQISPQSAILQFCNSASRNSFMKSAPDMNNSNFTTLINASLTQLENTKWANVGLILIGLFGFCTNILVILTIWKQKVLHNGCFVLIAQLAVAAKSVGT